MQTHLAEFIRDTAPGKEAERILRKCVHCGFCNATCPTYQLLGDELDGPRGRIYLMKQMLEGEQVSQKSQLHLDRCLTCLNCESTCPSGVEYGKLLDIGRLLTDQRVPRPIAERVKRRLLRWLLPYPGRFTPLLRLSQFLKPLLPAPIKTRIPSNVKAEPPPTARHDRRMLILDGCVQSALTPTTNSAAVEVLDRCGISVVNAKGAGCCGALSHHLGATDEAHKFMKRNIDAWWPQIEQGAQGIITTASGCGLFVKQYNDHLNEDPAYRDKAARVSALTRDIAEVLPLQDINRLKSSDTKKIAFHPPCTLQHGQKLKGQVETILSKAGFELVSIRDSHLCCGSAGTYSILQADLSQRLLRDKLNNLQAQSPELIATANIGCQLHLQSRAEVPVVHWIELFSDTLR